MPNVNNSLTLDTAARSDPRDNRLILSYIENGMCIVEVMDCVDVGALTFEINGDATEIICTNLRTGRNEVVGTIDAGSTRKATFDMSRYLPAEHLSSFLRRVELNCGLRLYMARGTECIDPFNVNEFSVLDSFGEVTLGNYTRTEMRHKDKSEAAAIMEGTTVTAYDFKQLGLQQFAVRGAVAVNPLVGIALCDKRVCGGQCADDSDGCQKWLAVDNTGQVTYTTDQFFSEALVPNTPALDGTNNGIVTSICCIRGQLVLLEETDLAGHLHWASLETILDGGIPAWSTISADTTATALEELTACQESPDTFNLWMVGENNSLYQYSPTLGTVTPVPTVPGLTVDYEFIDILGETILIGGNNAVVVRSQDGGRSFQQVTITDPATGLDLVVGITLTAGDVLNKTSWSVGTSDGRVLYTIDDGDTWFEQVIPDGDGTQINDLHFDDSFVGFMVQGTQAFKTYYGNCQPWATMPESSDPIPANNGLVRILNCPDDPNVTVAVGESDAGAGLVLVASSEYR